jgi:hypothetical protein
MGNQYKYWDANYSCSAAVGANRHATTLRMSSNHV